MFRSAERARVPARLDVHPNEVGALTARIIDVREPHEYSGELGHLPGAELVPLAMLAATASAWDRDEPLLMVCRSGARSSRAADLLVGMGFTRIHNMVGGMLAVHAGGLPFVPGTAS